MPTPPRRFKLNREAAREDAELFIQAWGRVIREMYYGLVEPLDRWCYSLRRAVDYMREEEVLARFLAVVGLAAHADIAPPKDDEAGGSPVRPVELLAFIRKAVEDAYEYASGNEGPSVLFPVLDAALANFICLAGPGSAFRSLRSNVLQSESELLSETVSPRFAFAMALRKARWQFEEGLAWDRSIREAGASHSPEASRAAKTLPTVMPWTITLLSGVSYSHIMKLIKTGKLPAQKILGSWRIPAIDAARLMLERGNCPEWLKAKIISYLPRLAPETPDTT